MKINSNLGVYVLSRTLNRCSAQASEYPKRGRFWTQPQIEEPLQSFTYPLTQEIHASQAN